MLTHLERADATGRPTPGGERLTPLPNKQSRNRSPPWTNQSHRNNSPSVRTTTAPCASRFILNPEGQDDLSVRGEASRERPCTWNVRVPAVVAFQPVAIRGHKHERPLEGTRQGRGGFAVSSFVFRFCSAQGLRGVVVGLQARSPRVVTRRGFPIQACPVKRVLSGCHRLAHEAKNSSLAFSAVEMALFGTIWHCLRGSLSQNAKSRNELRQIKKRVGTPTKKRPKSES